MTCVWTELKADKWSACLLESGARSYELSGEADSPVRALPDDTDTGSVEVPLLVRSDKAKRIGEIWGLLCGAGSGVRVNGRPVAGSLRVLRDRDEIRAPGLGTIFFTEDSRAVVQPLPPMEREPQCPRCQLPISVETPAVRCPNCGKWHHEIKGAGPDEDLPCWTYTDRCAFCGHPTSLEVGFRWSPEEA